MKPNTDNNSLIIGKEYFYDKSLKYRGIYLGKNDLGCPIFKPTNETIYCINEEGNISFNSPVTTEPATKEVLLNAKFFVSHYGFKFCMN